MGMYMVVRAAPAVTLETLTADNEGAARYIDEGKDDAADLDKGWDVCGRLLRPDSIEGLYAFAEPLGSPETDLGYGPPMVIRGARRSPSSIPRP